MNMTQWGDLPAVQLTLASGASVTTTLFGAHVVSWKVAGGHERMFCSSLAVKDGSKAIRGGVPVIFPQFSDRGTGIRHGFARLSTWRLENSGGASDSAFARFILEPSDLATAWPHDFLARLTVTLRNDSLAMALDIINTGTTEFAFSAALHNYYLIDALGTARVTGVTEEPLTFTDKFEQIYQGVGSNATLEAGSYTLSMVQSGFPDAAVWNPGAKDTAALPDMEDDEYHRFLCVEPALVEPMALAPARSWRGELVMNSN